jgi:hypothetical protein
MEPQTANRQFEPEGLYLQWLRRRRAWPMRIDQRVMPFFWIISGIVSFLYVVSVNSRRGEIFKGDPGSGTDIIAYILPLMNIFLDFIYYIPRCVHDDETSSMMQFIFMAPVDSKSIIHDLRKWAVLINLRHLAPSAMLIFVCILAILHHDHSLSQDLSQMISYIIPVIILIFLFWAFLLGTGLASAGLPWKGTSPGLIVLCWVVLVLAVVLCGGSYIASRTNDLYFLPRRFEDYLYSYTDGFRNYGTEWLMWHFIILMSIPTAFTHIVAPRLMERSRRDGY